MPRTKFVTLRMTDAQVELLDLACERVGASRADVLLWALQQAAATEAGTGPAEWRERFRAALQQVEDEGPRSRRGARPKVLR